MPITTPGIIPYLNIKLYFSIVDLVICSCYLHLRKLLPQTFLDLCHTFSYIHAAGFCLVGLIPDRSLDLICQIMYISFILTGNCCFNCSAFLMSQNQHQ